MRKILIVNGYQSTPFANGKLNALAEAFNNPSEPFIEGMSLDDWLRSAPLNAQFFGMKSLLSLGTFDGIKNPASDAELTRSTRI